MNAKRPLDGVKVLELATFVAAPCCTRYLAELGADVIKVETKKGDNLRYTALNEGRPFGDMEDTTYAQENGNKRAVIIDIKSEAGQEAFLKLVDWCDIFVTNLRPNALKRAGIDYETLSATRPSLVMGLVSGHGEKGPEKDIPGYDFTSFFARSGVMGTMFDKDACPMLPCAGFGDHQVGMSLAAGLMAALLKARETGEGDQVTVSLLQMGIFDVAINLTASQYGDPSMQYTVARKEIANQLQLPHKTKDGRWFMVAIPPYDLLYNKFIAAIGRKDLVNDERFYPQKNALDNLPELHDIIAAEFIKKTAAEWQAIFAEADLPAAKCYTWAELLEDEQCWANDYLAEVEFPSGNKRTIVRSPNTFSKTTLAPAKRAPFLGEHTLEVMAELGYSPEEIDTMLESGAIHDVIRIG